MKKRIFKKIFAALGLLIILGLLGLFLLSGDNFDLIRSLFLEEHTDEELRDKLSDLGIKGYATIAILSMLQLVVSVLPAEPVQVVAGLAFGFPIGIACCAVGVVAGCTIIFVLYRTLGNKIRQYFVKNLHFDFEKAARSNKTTLIVFILYFLPAIPYGMICFFAASIGIKYPRYIFVNLLGAIPSICIGVGLGHIAISTSWVLSLILFCVLIIIISILMIKRKAIFDKVNSMMDKPSYSSKTTVKKYSKIILPVAYVISRIVFFFKGVKVKYTNKLGRNIESPSIVLCNHGSFIDFAYAGTLIRKRRPHFVVARLYFYKKLSGKLLRKVGCFPKSMFTQDIESAKNCLKVLKSGSVLAMMPEARLSTVGKFEDIQEGTYHFLKKSGVPVYSIKIQGDYFASPKWGDGLRRGSLVEAELDILFTPEELLALDVSEIKNRVEERLSYNEFDWIKTKPRQRYKSKRLAEGLENILSLCPKCMSKYTLYTKGKEVLCEKCGSLAALDDRYSFVGGEPFENFADWYSWQSDKMKEEIESNPDFALSSKVEFCLPSLDGKKMLRTAGYGVCTLTKHGLTYKGERDGEELELSFPAETIYRLLFGAGENFEIYVGNKIHYFRPENRRSAVDWYIASSILFGNK